MASPQSRRDWCVLGLVVAVVLPAAALTRHSWSQNSNDLAGWVDAGSPARRSFEKYSAAFGRPEFIVVTWPGASVGSPEMKLLEDQLRQPPLADLIGPPQTIATVAAAIRELPRRADRAAVLRQFEGVLYGPGRSPDVLIVNLTPAGQAHRFETLRAISSAAIDSGVRPAELKIGGIGAEMAWLDHESVASPARLVPVIAAVTLTLCWLLLRRLWLAVAVSSIGVVTGLLAAAMLPLSGVGSNAILATLPTLGGLLAISLSLHLIAYVKHEFSAAGESGGKVSVWESAVRGGTRTAIGPTLVSAGTTAIGIGSLSLSRTSTISQFGMLGAAVVAVAAGLTLAVMPAVLRRLGAGGCRWDRSDAGDRWGRWAGWLSRRRGWVLGVLAIAVVAATAGLPRLRTGVSLKDLFTDTTAIVADAKWLSQNVGSTTTCEVLVDLPADQPVGRQFLSIAAAGRRVAGIGGVTHCLTAATFFGDLDGGGLAGVLTRDRVVERIERDPEILVQTGYVVERSGRRAWRMSVRGPLVDRSSAETIERQIRGAVRAAGLAAADVEVTGLTLMFEQIERQFMADLRLTYAGSLLLITAAVSLVLRSVAGGLVAMVPNLLPAAGVLGVVSWLGVRLDVGSVMTASIALGIAVDDTLHLTLWTRRRRAAGDGAFAAVVSSLRHCGPPVLQTSIICGGGLAVLGAAPFLPTARFGVLIALMLIVALVGDLVLLPALLMGRGKSVDPA